MSEIHTTSINDLPTDPAGGGSIGGNISMMTNETNMVPPSAPPMGGGQLSLDQTTISQIVNGLQQATLSGATQLPSRDIPLNTEKLVNDEYVQPNYVPPPSHTDYISDNDNNIDAYYKQENMANSLENIYDELQAPLMLAVLYFLFQLPFFKKIIFKYLPFLCHNDGNYNINGLIFTCALFGFIYHLLSKSVKYFSKF